MLLGWTRRSRRFERDALPHLPAIYRLARQLVGVETANDLVQETFLRAWKYFDTFDSTTNCRAWLFRILRNVWIGRWRKSRLELPLAETGEEQIEPYYDWEDEFLRGEMSAEVERALSELPVDYRITVLLADVEEFTYEEIARVTECPIGTVMSRLNRGRKMLARLIRAYGERKISNPTPEEFGENYDGLQECSRNLGPVRGRRIIAGSHCSGGDSFGGMRRVQNRRLTLDSPAANSEDRGRTIPATSAISRSDPTVYVLALEASGSLGSRCGDCTARCCSCSIRSASPRCVRRWA